MVRIVNRGAFGFGGDAIFIAVKMAVCAMAIRDGKIPPMINLENPYPEGDLDYTPHVAREKNVRVAVNNSFGFGGHNATLVITEFKD